VPVRRPAAEALSLDRLIRDGPPDGDLLGGLEATRLKILDQGIKSDGDGMVRATYPSSINGAIYFSTGH
jgi:cell cycle arrest protein BUB2